MVTSTNNLDGTITIGFGDNFADIGRALRDLPKITPEEAKKLISNLEKRFAKMNTQTHKKRD
jgi:hypothetical protein